MTNNKSYKLKHPETTNNGKRDYNTGVSNGAKKVLKSFLMTALWSKKVP